MSIVDTVKGVLSRAGVSIHITLYECAACDNVFESEKGPDRAQCPYCLSNTVHQVE